MIEDGVERSLRRFVECLERGETQAALRAASDACHAAPDRAEPHYAYGQAWLAVNDSARAERAFAAAIQRAPGWADAWVNFGVARYRQDAINDAKTAMRAALRAEPGHPVATANLGVFQLITGESEAGEALLRDALARAPDSAAARLNLVADLLREERAEEALALLDDAHAPTDPRARQFWDLQRALVLLQVRRLPQARATLTALADQGRLPRELLPLWHWRALLLAQAERLPADARDAAVAMAEALADMGPEATPEHRIMGHYNLARFWSGEGEHARAFAHWRSGHELLAPLQPFSRAAAAAFIDANIATFTAAFFATTSRATSRDATPVFIVGMPRSGTTLCEQILDAHPAAHGAGERTALGQAFARLGGGTVAAAVPRIAALDQASLDVESERYLAELRALAPGASRIIDKMPGNYLHLGLVGRLLPGAAIIHCVRDPRDIGLSIFTFRFHGEHGYAHDLRDLGWTIARQERLMAHWRAALPNPILTVRLSDWVTDFSGTLARVLAHVGLPHDPACERFHESDRRVRTVSRAQVRQPVNARGLGRWRAYAMELSPLIEELGAAGALADWSDFDV